MRPHKKQQPEPEPTMNFGEEAAMLALVMWRLAEMRGDHLRVELARAIRRECGYPEGCEDAPTVKAAQAAIERRDGLP